MTSDPDSLLTMLESHAREAREMRARARMMRRQAEELSPLTLAPGVPDKATLNGAADGLDSNADIEIANVVTMAGLLDAAVREEAGL